MASRTFCSAGEASAWVLAAARTKARIGSKILADIRMHSKYAENCGALKGRAVSRARATVARGRELFPIKTKIVSTKHRNQNARRVHYPDGKSALYPNLALEERTAVVSLKIDETGLIPPALHES